MFNKQTFWTVLAALAAFSLAWYAYNKYMVTSTPAVVAPATPAA